MRELIYKFLAKILCRKKQDYIRMNWKKAQMQRLMERKDTLTPEQFLFEYRKLEKTI